MIMSGCLEPIRSGPSDIPMLVRFANRTTRHVDIIWLDHSGNGVRYAKLGPFEWCQINTFETHPWIFRDNSNGYILVALPGHVEVYQPKFLRNPQSIVAVPIIEPVVSLKKCALNVIDEKFTKMCMLETDWSISLLPIPTNIKEDLKSSARRRINYKITFENGVL